MSGGVRRSEIVVGRAVELQQLHDAIRAVARGGSGCLFLVADAGLGKTRLLGETAALAGRLGVPVLRARASAVAPAAFGVVAEALRSWLRAQSVTAAPAATRPPDAFDDGLRLIVPEWPGRQPAIALTDNQLRLLAFEAVVRLVSEIAEPRGVVVLFDDLHDADADSIEVIRYLVAALPDRTLVVGALRGSEGVVANDTVTGLGAAGHADIVRLRRLERDEVADLLAALLGGRPPEPLVDDVAGRTDGVPLLVEEVLDAHVRNGSILRDDSGVHWRGGTAVPATVVATVARRLDRLNAHERSVIVAAAVVGEVDAELLGAVAQQPPDVVNDALVHGVELGLIETIAGRLDFRHAVLRDATIEGALPHVVAAMHERAAAALAARPEQTLTLREREGRHLDAVGRRDEAAQHFVAASNASRSQRALLDAERLARAACERATTPDTDATANDALAAALAALGRWSEALAVDESTADRCGHDRDRWLRMAQCALDARLIERAHALLADAHATDDDQSFVYVTMGRLALCSADVDTAFACAARADELAGTDAAARCAALDLRARALEIAGHRGESSAAYAELVELAGAAGLVDVRLRALVCLTEFELFEGRPPVRMFEACDLAREHGALVEQAWAELNLAIALLLQGNPHAGYEMAAATEARARSMRLDLLPFVLVARAGAEAYLGRGDYEATLAEARALAGDAGDLAVHTAGIRGSALMLAGRYAEATVAHERGVEALRANAGGIPSDSACWIVFSLAAAGRPDDAARALAEAPTIAGTLRWHATPTLLDAAAALLDHDGDRLDVVLGSADGGNPFELAQIRVIAAEVIGGPHHTRWLRDALDTYEAAGCEPAADRVRSMLRDAGGTVPRGRSRGRVPPSLIPYGVTAREAQVLELVAAGATNAAVAERLFISVRTVESHVSSLLTKLGASSRDDLATWVEVLADPA